MNKLLSYTIMAILFLIFIIWLGEKVILKDVFPVNQGSEIPPYPFQKNIFQHICTLYLKIVLLRSLILEILFGMSFVYEFISNFNNFFWGRKSTLSAPIFLPMPSIYSRLVKYQELNKKPPLTQEQKVSLGHHICQQYLSQTRIKKALHRMMSIEPEGKFIVLSYPEIYLPEIDRYISEFYSTLPQPKVRKRIPKAPSPTKEFSVKPSGQISGQS